MEVISTKFHFIKSWTFLSASVTLVIVFLYFIEKEVDELIEELLNPVIENNGERERDYMYH